MERQTLKTQSNLIKGKDYIGVGVGAVILDQDQVLLLQRLREPEAGYWGIQGEAVEFGETIEDAIKRELKEELSVDVEIITLLGVTNHILTQEKIHWVSPVFLVTITAGTPKNMEKEMRTVGACPVYNLRCLLTCLPDNQRGSGLQSTVSPPLSARQSARLERCLRTLGASCLPEDAIQTIKSYYERLCINRSFCQD